MNECITCGKSVFSKWFDTTEYYGHYGSKQCKRCWNKRHKKEWLEKHKEGIPMFAGPDDPNRTPTDTTSAHFTKDQLMAIDQEVAATHDSKQEILTLRNRESCKLFRCVVCWHYIFADDSITSFKDGYAHKTCIP